MFVVLINGECFAGVLLLSLDWALEDGIRWEMVRDGRRYGSCDNWRLGECC